MDSLQAMGFDAALCRRALEVAENNDVDQAVELLLTDDPRLRPEPAPTVDLLLGFDHEEVTTPTPPPPPPPPVQPAGPAEPPDEFVCSITFELMEDPVVCDDGHTFERSAIEEWLVTHDTSPRTGEPLMSKRVVPNITLRNQIREWKVEHRPAAPSLPAPPLLR